MAFIPTNKPHKNTEAEKMWTDLKGNRQRIYQTISHLFLELRYYAVNMADKNCRSNFSQRPNILPFKVKVKQTFERNNLNCVFTCKL